MSRLLLRKSVQDCENDILERGGLKRSLGKWHLTAVDLMALGIGAIIGAGIFATLGTARRAADPPPAPARASSSRSSSRPSPAASARLCYAEFAGLVPVAGSAYTYSYATLGELVAWIIGWDLILEYAVGNIAVAISWAAYFRQLLARVRPRVPAWLATDYRSTSSRRRPCGRRRRSALARAVGRLPAHLHHPVLFGVPIVFNLLAVAHHGGHHDGSS